MFNAIETMPCIKRKAQWALNWINPERVSSFQMLSKEAGYSILDAMFHKLPILGIGKSADSALLGTFLPLDSDDKVI